MRLAAIPPKVSVVHPDSGAKSKLRVESKPLHLTATCTVQPGSSSGVNAVALQNPLGTPMEIHEIKWSVLVNAAAASFAANSLLLAMTKANGSTLRCRFDLGTIEITNGYVPVSLFGKSAHESAEAILQRLSPAATTGYTRLEYSWKLSTPLYIPAGGVLAPTFEHSGQLPYALDVRIGYVVRSLPRDYKPSKVILPWVAAYASPTFDMSAASIFNSSELDLANKWDGPLVVDRLAGRFSVFDNSLTAIYDSPFMGLANLNMRLVDSFGNAIVRGLTPFSHIFHNHTKTWEMHATLPAKSYYQAFFNYAATVAVTANTYFGQALVAVVGSREAK